MPGFMPGIHVFLLIIAKQDVDGRDKPGHDVEGASFITKSWHRRYSSICALPVSQRSANIAATLKRISTTDSAAAISNVPLSMKL
jgi:hypothetical protein